MKRVDANRPTNERWRCCRAMEPRLFREAGGDGTETERDGRNPQRFHGLRTLPRGLYAWGRCACGCCGGCALSGAPPAVVLRFAWCAVLAIYSVFQLRPRGALQSAASGPGAGSDRSGSDVARLPAFGVIEGLELMFAEGALVVGHVA